jgi:hypothetical protein
MADPPRGPGSTEIFSALATFAFAFDVGPCHVAVLAELPRQARLRWAGAIFAALLGIAGAMYGAIAVFGYLQFTSRVCPNVIESYTGERAGGRVRE